MDIDVKIRGLKSVLKAMDAAFPKNPKQKQRLLAATMKTAAKPTILAHAKRLAIRGDTSGALSESLGLRSQSRAKIRTRRITAGAEIVPVRDNVRAMALYVAHYYTSRGKIAPANIAISGIRHGHLVEFGFKHISGRAVAARPFLAPAGRSGFSSYKRRFAKDLRKKTEAAVRRARKRK